MSKTSEVKKLIQKGFNKELKFLTVQKTPHSDELAAINKVAPIMPGNYLSIGGTGGAGKSSYVNHYLVFSLFKKWKRDGGIKPQWLYYFTERDPRVQLYAKFWAWLMYVDHGIVIDVPTLFQWPNKSRELGQQDMDLIDELEPQVAELEKMVTVHSSELLFDEMGNPIVDKKGKQKSKPLSLEAIQRLDDDFQREKGCQVIRILDHVNNVKQDGMGERQVLERASDHSKWVRDSNRGWLVCDLNQFNRDTSGSDRQLKMKMKVSRSDWFGSDKFYQNADWMLGLLDPSDYEASRLHGYRIQELSTPQGACRLRGAWIVKNSYGPKGASIPLFFQGESGVYLEVPPLETGDEIPEQELEQIIKGNIFYSLKS